MAGITRSLVAEHPQNDLDIYTYGVEKHRPNRHLAYFSSLLYAYGLSLNFVFY